MTLKEYSRHISRLIKEGHGSKVVVSSSDDEGNSFSDVHYTPSLISVKGNSVYRGKETGDVICVN